MDILNKIQKIKNALEDKKGEDIEVINVEGKTSIADYMVICSGTSTPQIKALVGEVEEVLQRDGILPRHIEGYSNTATWVLMDYSDVIVHVFHVETRKFYDLERLFSDAARIVPSRTDEN